MEERRDEKKRERVFSVFVSGEREVPRRKESVSVEGEKEVPRR